MEAHNGDFYAARLDVVTKVTRILRYLRNHNIKFASASLIVAAANNAPFPPQPIAGQTDAILIDLSGYIACLTPGRHAYLQPGFIDFVFSSKSLTRFTGNQIAHPNTTEATEYKFLITNFCPAGERGYAEMALKACNLMKPIAERHAAKKLVEEAAAKRIKAGAKKNAGTKGKGTGSGVVKH